MSQPAPRPTRRQSIEQQRAEFALRSVLAVKGRPYASDYLQQVRGLAAMVLTNGLGQTLAFLKAKAEGGRKDREHWAAYRQLSDWIAQQLGQAGDLLTNITAMDVGEYRLAQVEALAVLGWLKRFAEAEIPERRS